MRRSSMRHFGACMAITIALLFGVVRHSYAQVLASTGFNDVFGINGDGIPNNLPYNIHNAGLQNQGSTDPGFSSWGGVSGQVVNSGQFEGDGAALIIGSGGSFAQRLFSLPGLPSTPPPFRVSAKIK